MKTATLAILGCVAASLCGCDTMGSMIGMGPDRAGRTVEFIASNPDSVLLDFASRPPGELAYAQDVATSQCGIFNRHAAVLESLNTRSDGRVRATYACGR